MHVPYAFAVRAQDMTEPGLNWAAKGADAEFVRCDTEATRDAMLQLLPELKDKLLVLRDPLTLTPPEEMEEQMPVPAGGDAANDADKAADFNLLAVGTIARRKGYDLLLRACRLLADRNVNFSLTFVGQGPEKLRLRWLVWRLGLRGSVQFAGQIPHVRQKFAFGLRGHHGILFFVLGLQQVSHIA